jgi:hypothetical protein
LFGDRKQETIVFFNFSHFVKDLGEKELQEQGMAINPSG